MHTLDDGFDYDTGGLYVCSGGCAQWLVAKARKQGLQTKVDQYSLSAYQKCGEQSWIPAKMHSYQFITAACDEDDEEKAAKAAKKSNPRKRKRGKSPTPSAGAAIPTALPPPIHDGAASAAASATADVVEPQIPGAASAAASTTPDLVEPASFGMTRSAIKSLQASSRKMRTTFEAFASKTEPTGGTCNDRARVILNCQLNHMEEHIATLTQAVFGCMDAARGPQSTQLASNAPVDKGDK